MRSLLSHLSHHPPTPVHSAFDATCELCGFDFENRKALASHARAHLRQQGVEWRTNGSPIETLSAWMQREPGKVAELHKRYMMGDLPHIRKVGPPVYPLAPFRLLEINWKILDDGILENGSDM